MQFRERQIDQGAGDSPSSASVRSCRDALVFMFMLFTNRREHIVVVQTGVIICSGIMRIARTVRSSRSTGIKRSATTCSRVPIHLHSTGIYTTSMMGHKMTYLKIQLTQARRQLRPGL